MSEKNTLVLNLSKVIHSTAEKAFSAFTEPEELSIWFTKEAKVDLRVGGKYSNGDLDKGEFLEIEPPYKLRFTWENNDHCPGTEVQIRFVQKDENRLKVILDHSKLESKEHMDDMKTGWSWALASLKSYLETGKPVTFEDWQFHNNLSKTDQ